MLNLFYYINIGYLKFFFMKIKFVVTSRYHEKFNCICFRVIHSATDNAGEFEIQSFCFKEFNFFFIKKMYLHYKCAHDFQNIKNTKWNL